jgi:DNA helicase-2/ATP-dependent DNA helicase PcrA
VIDVLNRLRTDIKQFPAYKNVPGDAVYFHVAVPDAANMGRVREFTKTKLGWTPNEGSERELYLTHKLIARKGGYEGLLTTFDKRGSFHRDRMLSGDDPRIAFCLDRVEALATAWAEKKTGLTLSLLRSGGFELTSNQGKKATADALEKLNDLRRTGDVRAVLTHLRDSKLTVLPDDLDDRLAGKAPKVADDPEAAEREAKDVAFYAELLGLPYAEIIAYTAFFREHTPFATKHGVKGTEFDTVFVTLDDKGARWNTYSFDKYLSREDETGNVNRFRRTRNVFYVCCSRAKKNLAVIDLGATSAKKTAGVQALFGAAKCFEI